MYKMYYRHKCTRHKSVINPKITTAVELIVMLTLCLLGLL